MKNKSLPTTRPASVLGLACSVAAVLAPADAHACACGCGVYDVGTSSMFPQDQGGMAYVNYDYQNQNENWSDTSSAPAANNSDKKIETHFMTVGMQYMFNNDWGAQMEVPVWNRTFKTDLNFGNPGPANVVSDNWTGIGDIRLRAIYTGLAQDFSTALTLGMKLPTGVDNHDPTVVDRDTQIGTGSTDLLLGGYHRGRFGVSHWFWFGQVEFDQPLLKTSGYRPGWETDVAAGIYYNGLSLGRVQISPVAQVIASWRDRDRGPEANTDASGYQRVLLSPGIEFHIHPVKIYADVELPVYQNMNGNQLVASALFKLNVSYMF